MNWVGVWVLGELFFFILSLNISVDLADIACSLPLLEENSGWKCRVKEIS
jgi:hypothetical protein